MNRTPAIFFFNIGSDLLGREREILDKVDLLTFSKMTSDKRRCEYLSSRFLLRSVITGIYGIDYSFINYSPNGKPHVDKIFFNLSHSGDRMVLFVDQTNEVGIDIQKSGREKNFAKIAQQYFNSVENEYISSAGESNLQLERFKNLWALKESYIKASDSPITSQSVQIHFDLERLCVSHIPSHHRVQFAYVPELNLALAKFSNEQARISPEAYEMAFEESTLTINKRLDLNYIQLLGI